MADLSQEELKRAFTEALKESGRDLNYDGKDLDKLMDNLKKLDKDVEKNRSTMGGLAKEMLSGRRIFKDFSAEIDSLDNQLEKLADTADESEIALRGELSQRRESIQRMAQHNAAQKAVVEGLVSFSKTLTNTAGRTISGFAKGLQDGSSAFSLAGGVMEGAMDVANAGAQAVGGGMTAVGQTMMSSTNPRLRMLGLISAGAGVAISSMSEAASAVGKFIVGYMIKQLDLTVDAFNKTSAAGALFSNGMTGMVNSATDAGLTVQQFGDVISKNSTMLAQSGFGVGQAARLMGEVGANMRKSGITTNLLKLGYGFQEQAELTAQVMSDLRTANSTILKDPAGIARATDQYATNLRVIASITGEDAKKKMDEARKASANVAFREKMMELEKEHPGIYQRYLEASASMTAQQQQNVQESVVFGTVINETGAIMDASSSALSNLTKTTADSIKDGTLDVKTNQQAQADALKEFRDNLKDVSAIGMAGMAGQLKEVNTALSEVVLASDRITKEGVIAAQDNADKQKVANDKLTKSVVSAAEQAQEMARQLQEMVLPQLANFAAYSAAILGKVREMLNEFGGGTGGGVAEDDSFWRKVLDYGGTAIGAGIGGVGAAAGTFGLGTVVGAVGGGMVGQTAGTAIADALGLQKKGEPIKGGQRGSGAPINGVVPTIPTGLVPGGRQGTGLIDPALQDKLGLLMQAFPGARITSLNDAELGSRDPTDVHARGRAIDFVPAGFDPKLTDQYIKTLRDMGFSFAQYERKGQTNSNGSVATGDHIHAQLANGGNLGAGETAIVGERGPEIVHGPGSVTSTAATSKIFGEMLDKLDDLLDVMKDHRDTSEKILHATQ